MKKILNKILMVVLIGSFVSFFGCGGGGAVSGGAPAVPGGGSPAVPGIDTDGDGIEDALDPDADGDGFLGAEDDCNDLDPAINPAAEDLPDHPDYTDTNCDGVDGDEDFAFWVSEDGNDANPGTIDLPFLTVQHAINQANLDPADIRDVYIVEGAYLEDINITDGVGLYGGYGALNESGDRARDIEVNIAELRNVMTFHTLGATTTGRETVIEGLTMVSVSENPTLIVMNSAPDIMYSNFRGSAGANLCLSVYVLGWGAGQECRPRLHNNSLTTGECVGVGSISQALTIASAGDGAIAYPEVYNNTIHANNAGAMSIGIMAMETAVSETSLTAYENDIQGATSSNVSAGIVLGYNSFDEAISEFTYANIYRNQIFAGESAFNLAGVVIFNGSDSVRLANNFITGGYNSMGKSVGVYLEETTVGMYNNSINSGTSAMMTECVELGFMAIAKMTNNIFTSEDAPFKVGISETTPASTPTILTGNLFDDFLDVMYGDFGMPPIVNIADVNAMADIPENFSNIAGAPQFTSFIDRDYHLTDSSDAIDTGIDYLELEDDIDGDARSADSYDIGADEFVE